ncbi:MAG: PAS domain S-box protein [Pseudomonadota bacterium]
MITVEKKSSVYIAERETLVSADLKSRLERLGGHVVGQGYSMDQAIEFLEKEQPDLVLLDLDLPGRSDGVGTAEIIREKWGVPVVFLAADTAVDRLERACSVNPLGCIIKPFQDINLVMTLKAAFSAIRAEAERKQVAEALHKSENRLRRVLDAVPHHIHAKDEEGRFIMANKAVAESYRLTPDDFVGRYHSAVGLDEAEVKGMLADDREVMVSGRPKHIPEETCIDADGRVHWLETTKTPFDNDGKPAVLVVAIDITARKKAQEELRASRHRLRLFLDASPDVFFLKDRDLRYQFVNKAGIDLLGRGESEILGVTGFELRPLAEAIKIRETDDQAMREKRTVISFFEAGNRVLESRKFPVLVDGESVGVAGIIRDITDRVRTAENLEKSEQRFRELFNSTTDLIYVQDLEGRFLSFNPAMRNLMGYAHEELLGHKTSEFMKPELRDYFETGYLEVLKWQGYQNGVTCYLSKDGGKKYIEYKSRLLFSENGDAYISGVGRDVTERVLAERKRKSLETQLKQVQKLEAVGRLAGGIAHDFNNLLQAINGYVQVLLLNRDEGDPDYRNIDGINRCAARAAQLVRQLLLYSRKAETERKLVGLNHELEHAKLLLERTIPKMIDIELNLDRELWAVYADPVQIEQIFLNLGVNAADAMPEGGLLTFRTENIVFDEESALAHFEAMAGKYVLLAVNDTGHGMDTETIEHIFEPFYTTKEVGKGTGLGLASVYGIVKSHGGYMTCLSEPGRGTVFNIYFPAVEAAVEAADEEKSRPPGVGGVETILLVDDENSISEIAAEYLDKFGYTVLTASSGEEALGIFATPGSRVDLLILDLGMPGMGGRKCLKEILKIDPSAKVLIASGYSIEGKISETVKAGAVGFIAKPYQLADLLSKIRDVLDQGAGKS